MPVAQNTSSSMIVRTANNAVYTIYNLGLNQILAGQDIISGIGDNWNFAVVPGAVNWDFAFNNGQGALDLWVSRPSGGNNQFFIYNISGNTNVTPPPPPNNPTGIAGAIGQDWKVQGFGYFFRSDFGQADMVTRQDAGGIATYKIYDTTSNQLNISVPGPIVGNNWNTAGTGTYLTNGFGITNNPNNFAGLLFLQTNTAVGPTIAAGTILPYVYRNGTLVNAAGSLPDSTGKINNPFAVTGQTVLGFGHFTSQPVMGNTPDSLATFPLGMITRDTTTSNGSFWIYDIQQNVDQTGAPYYTAVNGKVLIASGDVGSNMQFAGFAPVSGGLGPITDDMVLRNTNNGALQVYDIQDDTLTGSAPLTPPASKPIAPTSTVGGMAIDLSGAPPSGSTSQLVQAMASFGGGSGAADSLNTAPLSADTSQQTFLTTPQHA